MNGAMKSFDRTKDEATSMLVGRAEQLRAANDDKQPMKHCVNAHSAATRAKYLTTFKGGASFNSGRDGNNNNNSNSNNQIGGGSLRYPIRGPLDRRSLESLDSRFSVSSANDDSQAVVQQRQSLTSAQPARSKPLPAAKSVPPPVGGVDLVGASKESWLAPQQIALVSMASAEKPPEKQTSWMPPPASQSGEEQVNRNPVKPPFMFAGIVASIMGSVFLSLSVLCIKLMPDMAGWHENAKVLMARGFIMMLLCGTTIILQRSTFVVRRDELWVNLLRAVFGTAGVFLAYCSLNYISMGESTALIFSSPVWTNILSHFILGEPLQWFQLFALPASLFGIVLIAHPTLIVSAEYMSLSSHLHQLQPSTNKTSELAGAGNNLLAEFDALPSTATNLSETSLDLEHRWPGIAIALVASLVVSGTYIVLKFRKNTSIQTTTFWLGVCTFLSSLAIQSVVGFCEWPATWWEWLLLLCNGLASWLGQSCLQWAFLYEEAGLLSIVRTLDVVLTFLLSATFLEEDIYWTSVLGAFIIGLVVASVMLKNWTYKVWAGSQEQATKLPAPSSKDAAYCLEAKS